MSSRFAAVDNNMNFPAVVRDRMVANMLDAGAPEGAALSGAFVGANRMRKVIGLGTSITAGFSTAGQSWVNIIPSRLAALAPELPPVTAINGGVSGNNSAQMLARLPGLLSEHRDAGIVAIEVSVNDGKGDSDGLQVAQSVANMQRMISLVRFANATPVIIGTAPFDAAAWPVLVPQKIADVNAAIRVSCERSGVTYVDLATKLRGAAGIWADGLHPNMAGQEAWSAAIAAGIAGYSGTVVVDDFNRADNATTLGSSTSGSRWITPGGGSWGISGGKAYCASSENNLYALLPVESDDQTITVQLAKVQDFAGTGLVLRAAPDGTGGYVLNCDTGVIYAVVNDALTAVGDVGPFNNGDICRYSVAGSVITVQKNNETPTSFTNTEIESSRLAGLYHAATTTVARWENLTIDAM